MYFSGAPFVINDNRTSSPFPIVCDLLLFSAKQFASLALFVVVSSDILLSFLYLLLIYLLSLLLAAAKHYDYYDYHYDYDYDYHYPCSCYPYYKYRNCCCHRCCCCCLIFVSALWNSTRPLDEKHMTQLRFSTLVTSVHGEFSFAMSKDLQ